MRGFLLYFVCIGAGYILIQVALIQNFVLLLGHPTYALTVIVFSMLISSGVGSFFSRRARLKWVLTAIAAAVAALAFVAAPISEVVRGLSVTGKDAADGSPGRAGRLSDGHAVSRRTQPAGAAVSGIRALGLGTECGVQRDGFGHGHFSGDLCGPASHFTNRRSAVSLRVGNSLGSPSRVAFGTAIR